MLLAALNDVAAGQAGAEAAPVPATADVSFGSVGEGTAHSVATLAAHIVEACTAGASP